MQKQLTREEQQEYNKIKQNQFGVAEEEAANLCLQYYLAYRQHTNITNDKIALAFKCAFFMAEKSQFSLNMKGEKVRGIAFSLNKLLKDHKLDDTMFMLKQMTRKIRFIDEDTSTYLNNIVKQISFLIHLHSKFEKTFSQKLQLKEKINDGGSYCKLFASYAWLLFIIVKNQVLKRSLELLPNTCMVAHIICSMLVLAWDYIKPEGLMRGDKRLSQNSSSRQIKRIIKQKVLQIFCIKDINEYAKIANSFEQYFNHMLEMNLFRMNQDKWDFLSPENINVNYRKLDKYYEQSLSIEHLDERIFFTERTMNLTPSKFTPFARQGYANKFQKQAIGNKLGGPMKPWKQQTFNSHRVINYEAAQREVQNKNLPIHEIKLPKNIIQSPSMVKVPLVMATPISTGMQMYNYLNEKKKRIKQIHTEKRSFDKNVSPLIDQVFQLMGKGQNDKVNKDTKTQLIVALYKIFSEDYLALNSYEKDGPELMRAFLALSMELVFFVSNISLTFQKIEQVLQVQPFEMWKAIDYFLKSDKSIPFPIKLHFLDLEVNLVSFKIWQNMQILCKISSFGNKQKEIGQNETSTLIIQKLFKRLIHQSAFQITKLTNLLEIDETNSERVFETMKQILISCPQLLYHRHLDQLIICSIYANCKGIYKIMFNDIKEYHSMSNPNLKDIIEDIIVRVYVAPDQPDVDIITFYNKIFIQNPKVKDFITNIRTNANTENKNAKKNTLLMSPMKAIIPREINFKSKNNMNGNGKGKNNGLTPQTQLLYAYNQSPILKYEVNTFKPALKSKRVLDYGDKSKKVNNKSFEQELELMPSKPTTSDNNISPTNINNYQSTTDYINKKYARKTTTAQQTPQNQHMQTFMTHQTQTLQLPLQNLAKQNINPPHSGHSATSHRTLFEQKKDCYQPHQTSQLQLQQTKYKNKNYQIGAYRRE